MGQRLERYASHCDITRLLYVSNDDLVLRVIVYITACARPAGGSVGNHYYRTDGGGNDNRSSECVDTVVFRTYTRTWLVTNSVHTRAIIGVTGIFLRGGSPRLL